VDEDAGVGKGEAFLPAIRRKAPMEAACPMQNVITSFLMYCMVS